MNNNKLQLINIEDYNGFTFESLVGGENKVFEVPLFQRNYSWNKESCEQLFNDILNAFLNNETYYIGNFMFYNSTEINPNYTKFILIDGQQRITSLLLLLCAIRDIFPKMSYINKDFLINSYAPEQYKFKLKQNYNDIEDFKEIIDNKKNDSKNSPIYNAYNKFVELINNCEHITPSNVKNFYKTILHLETIGISFPNKDISKVQDIFEKINSTGVELSAADLIRNFLLFSSSIEAQQHLHSYWKTIEDIVGENNISKFAKSFLIRRTFNDVTKEKVYSEFKEAFKYENHEKILQSLIHYAVFFAMIEKQEFYEIKDGNYKKPIKYNFSDVGSKKYNGLSKLKTTFALLNKIGTDEINPFFFQLCDELYEKNIDKLDDICQLILEFMIRYMVVKPSAGGGALSGKIRKIMQKIDNREIKITKANIYDLLSSSDSEQSRYPGNDEFTSALKSFITQKNARVVLYQYSRRLAQELNSFDGKITLEHFMPQTIDEKTDEGKWWIKHLGGNQKYKDIEIIHKKYLNCIGNMGLLTSSLNSSISNGPWDKKREEIKLKAADKTTCIASNNEKWTEPQIKRRNKSLADKISKVITGPNFEKNDKCNWL